MIGTRPARRSSTVIAIIAALAAVSCVPPPPAPGPSGPPPSVGSCPAFPADNVWNKRVDQLPVDSRSAQYVASIGASADLWPDFGAGTWQGSRIGMPYAVVGAGQPRVPVSFEISGESDPGPYPIPPNVPIEEGNGDRHVIVIDASTCRLYEMYDAWPSGGGWRAYSGAVFDLRGNALRPARWTAADAAGLPIFPGLARYDEVARGVITHALRFTASPGTTRGEYIWPARHFGYATPGAHLPPMGQRFRLKAGVDLSGFSRDTRVILQALKTYGMILADNGPAWKVSGAPDDRWNNVVLQEMRRLSGNDFEAVDVSSMIIDPNSARAR